MRAKNVIALMMVLILTAAAALTLFGGLFGFTPVQESLSLGLDLRGGIYTVFQARQKDYSDAEFKDLLDATCQVLRTRLTERGYTEANVFSQGQDCIRIEIPEIEDPDEVIRLVGTPAHLEFVEPDGRVVIEGKDIKDVSAQMNNVEGGYEVAFVLTDAGSRAFEEATGRLIGRNISIVLDGEVISSPRVNNRITGGRGVITLGGGTQQDADELASLIRSGALPLDIHEIETRAISATLGEEAVNRAVLAGIIGLALVVVFMIVMYRLSGAMADIALVWYVMLVFGLIDLLGVQLTLPGIAGILLGIGMAVDANVVIFERFREELYTGRSGESALKAAFKHALSAILDSNVTTLIAAFVLMLFGTGPVKGFSYTLAISVFVSLFTAVFLTRFLLTRAVRLGLAGKRAYARPYKKAAPKPICAWFKKLRYIPAVIAAAALVFCLCGIGLKPGLDFTGGTLIEYAVGEEFSTEDVKNILAGCGYAQSAVTQTQDDRGGMTNVQITLTLAADEKIDVRPETDRIMASFTGLTLVKEETAQDGTLTRLYDGDADSDAVKQALEDGLEAAHCPFEAVHAAELDDDPAHRQLTLTILPAEGDLAARSVLDRALGEKYPNARYVSMEHTGAVSSAALVKNALLSLGAALVLMLIYIAIRFDLHSGAAALAALFHDVAIMVSAMCLFGSVYQVNASFIAALLTIVGYSINDTIVVFDRIRENKKRMAQATAEQIVNESVTASLARTVNTTITTLLTLICLYLLGVDSIREFTFPLLAGMLAGTFSSDLLSGPIWARLMARSAKKHPAQAEQGGASC